MENLLSTVRDIIDEIKRELTSDYKQMLVYRNKRLERIKKLQEFELILMEWINEDK